MIKDRNLKIDLIEYFVRRGWFPHLEVNVLSQTQMSRSPKLVTDIDAMALAPDITGKLQMILGDCKTLKGQSPITRALWMKGLMDYFQCKIGIIILIKDVEKEHQLTADHLDVKLFSSDDFKIYATATANYISPIKSSLVSLEHWDIFFEIDKKHPKLRPLSDYSRTIFWNEKSYGYQLRSGLSLLKSLKGELNPANNLHLSIVLQHYSLIAVSLNQIVVQLFTRYVSTKSHSDLSDDLKVFVYGGIGNYDFLNELRKKFSGSVFSDKDLSLPDWNSFVEFIRLAFENPINFNALPIFLKELSFCFLSDNPGSLEYAKTLKNNNKFTSNFALRLSDYLTKACNLPPEFNDIFSKAIVFHEFDL